MGLPVSLIVALAIRKRSKRVGRFALAVPIVQTALLVLGALFIYKVFFLDRVPVGMYVSPPPERDLPAGYP